MTNEPKTAEQRVREKFASPWHYIHSISQSIVRLMEDHAAAEADAAVEALDEALDAERARASELEKERDEHRDNLLAALRYIRDEHRSHIYNTANSYTQAVAAHVARCEFCRQLEEMERK